MTVQPSEPWITAEVAGFPGGGLSGTVAAGQSVQLAIGLRRTASLTPSLIHTGTVSLLEGSSGLLLGVIPVQLEFGGWTTLEPSVDTRHVYVSTSGDDNQNGLTPQTAKRTLAAAVQLLRDGYPDWLHVRRGDTFFESLGNWTKSGRSAAEPMVVTTYGSSDERPVLMTGTSSGLTVWGNGNSISDVAFVGLHFNAHSHNGSNGSPNGVSFLEPATRILFEDCKFERYFVNIVFQGTHRDLKVRRCVVVDAFSISAGHSQGIYLDGVDGCLIEQCIFDHNGYTTPDPSSFAGADIFRHNIYVQGDVRNFVLRGNIIARGPSHGIQMRSGGVAEDNLFLKNAINMLVGSDIGPAANGVPVRVVGNVFLDGRDINGSTRRGWVADFQSTSGGEVAYNIAAHLESGTNPKGFNFDSWLGAGVNNIDFHHNISYKWGAPVSFSGRWFSNLNVRSNDIQPFHGAFVARADDIPSIGGVNSSNNRFYTNAQPTAWVTLSNVGTRSLPSFLTAINDLTSVAQQVSYPNPDRTIVDYDLSSPFAGSGSLASFLSEARRQSRRTWRAKFVGSEAVRYFRANFGIVIP